MFCIPRTLLIRQQVYSSRSNESWASSYCQFSRDRHLDTVATNFEFPNEREGFPARRRRWVEEVHPSLRPSSMVDCSHYKRVSIVARLLTSNVLISLYRGHHVCGMIKSPLVCLKSHSDAVTVVVNLDSMGGESSEASPFWAHFMIGAWAALDGERESLGLCKEAPTVQDIMGKIKFVHPNVRFSCTFTTLHCGTHSFFVGAVANELF